MVYGCLPPKIDLRDFKVQSAKVYAASYPVEFELTELPPVKNQREVNSCCAHAASSVLEFYDKSAHKLSTNFFYGIQKKLFGQGGQGMYLVDACKIAKNYGDMLESDCPGNDEVPNCRPIAEEAFNNSQKRKEAYKYRIASYYSCKTNDDIKYALMHYGPILASVRWYDSYITTAQGVLKFNTNTNSGLHAIMIYGWNQDGWLIQNSWGESFANKGRFILPFEYGINEARVMVDWKEGEPVDPALTEPKAEGLLEIIYKILNFILNIVLQR